jgi:hypothetical protein
MTSDIDSKTLALWGDAIVAALKVKNSDRNELLELLRHGNEVTPAAAEFLAWLLDGKKKKGRPPLPAKFMRLFQMANSPNLYDAVMDFEMERARWYAVAPFPPYKKANKKRFPYEKKLVEIADRWDVDRNTLQNNIERSANSGKKLGS